MRLSFDWRTQTDEGWISCVRLGHPLTQRMSVPSWFSTTLYEQQWTASTLRPYFHKPQAGRVHTPWVTGACCVNMEETLGQFDWFLNFCMKGTPGIFVVVNRCWGQGNSCSYQQKSLWTTEELRVGTVERLYSRDKEKRNLKSADPKWGMLV